MQDKNVRSKDLFSRAVKVMPGGVNSPVRACQSAGIEPVFIQKALGSKLYTADGQELLDFVMSWGPMLLGYSHPDVTAMVQSALLDGTSFGAPCEFEVMLAEQIVDALPAMDMVRMVNSGTEAAMSALRLARAATGKSKVIKFIGAYHGHSDAFMASAGSGIATQCIPGTPGVPEEVVKHTLLAEYNDLQAVEDLFAAHGSDIAAVIVEPVAGNMGCVPPKDGFLQGLRNLTDKHGSLLIFDEVITGFRVEYGGAQTRFKIEPDLTCLGKIIGGGLPVGAYGGKREYMTQIAPVGPVYQAGTLAGNPLAMAAGLATLQALQARDYPKLEQKTKKFTESFSNVLNTKGIAHSINTIASIFTVFFTETKVMNFEQTKGADQQIFPKLYRHLREQGVNIAPSPFECAFLSFAHTDEDLDFALKALESFSPK
jgi:glutamate-1-semialdehyde 2,1-aminomutase